VNAGSIPKTFGKVSLIVKLEKNLGKLGKNHGKLAKNRKKLGLKKILCGSTRHPNSRTK